MQICYLKVKMKYIQPNPTDFRKLFNSTEHRTRLQEQHDGDVKLSQNNRVAATQDSATCHWVAAHRLPRLLQYYTTTYFLIHSLRICLAVNSTKYVRRNLFIYRRRPHFYKFSRYFMGEMR